MSDTRAVTSSHIELVVLGCLSRKAPPSDAELGDAVRELCLRDELPERARKAAVETLTALRQRQLVNDRELTDTGARVLRVACGVARRPPWSTFRQRYFAAIALGVIPTVPKKKGGTAALVHDVARRLGVEETDTMNGLCDALIAKALQMPPGPLTLARIRTHILAQSVYAATNAASDKAQRPEAVPVVPTARPEASGPPREMLPVQDAARSHTEPGPIAHQPEVQALDLLAFVRKSLTEIGDDGRFGAEKVFVSALWHQLADRGPPTDLSLDHFKEWLVTANRNRWLTLARADVVGAMDPKKVRESEIQDRGATFHFVLDPARNPAAQQGRSHVR